MVVSQLTYKSSYTGNGVSSSYNINFPFQEDTERIQVFLDDVLQASGYTVEWTGSVWVIEFVAPPAVDVNIEIVRNTGITQDMIYDPNEDFPAKSHEAALDKLTMISQELAGRGSESEVGSGIPDGPYGDIIVSGGGTIMSVTADAITLAKMADIGPGVIGRSSGVDNPVIVGFTELTGLLSPFSAIATGLVPASGGGTSNFLRADGSWGAPSLSAVWGAITGSITDQTDLMAQLGGKASTTHTHVADDISDASAAGKTWLKAADVAAQTALLNLFSTTAKGLVPTSPGGTSQYLRADGSWFTPPGGGGGGGPPPDGNYGDITVSGTGTVMTINADAVTNAKMADMAANTIKGTLSAGNPIDLTGSQVTTILDQFSSSLKGVVPSSGGGTTNYLRADGTWAPPAIAWGSITGTLSSQSDLQTALNGKQASDASLTSIAALGTAANKTLYTTGIDTWAETAITATGRSVIGGADAAAIQGTLGLVPGTHVQAFDADLNTIAGLTATTNNIIQSVGSAWASRTPAQVAATMPVEVLGEYTAIDAKTASYPIVLADKGKLLTGNHATVAIVFTVPANSTDAFPVKSKIDLASLGAAEVSVAGAGGVTIRSSGSKLKLTGQYSGASLTKIGTDEWLLVGDLKA